MPEPAERTALYRLYSTNRFGNLLPAVSDIYPRRMEAWRYLGDAGSCPAGRPQISYSPFEWKPRPLVARVIKVEWSPPDPLAPVALYRLYDSTGALLYVGITTDPKARFTQHSIYKGWWPTVARTTVAWLEVTRQEALAIEAATIRDEEPIHNGKHNARIAPFTSDTWPAIDAPIRQKANTLANLMRAEIECGRWQPGMRIPEGEAMAAASGVSVGTADRAYACLKREGLLVARIGHGTFVAQ
jgi:predicted GIY-YIG superfamily endonuclease